MSIFTQKKEVRKSGEAGDPPDHLDNHVGSQKNLAVLPKKGDGAQ
jgi:hypothetical protein